MSVDITKVKRRYNGKTITFTLKKPSKEIKKELTLIEKKMREEGYVDWMSDERLKKKMKEIFKKITKDDTKTKKKITKKKLEIRQSTIDAINNMEVHIAKNYFPYI